MPTAGLEPAAVDDNVDDNDARAADDGRAGAADADAALPDRITPSPTPPIDARALAARARLRAGATDGEFHPRSRASRRFVAVAVAVLSPALVGVGATAAGILRGGAGAFTGGDLARVSATIAAASRRALDAASMSWYRASDAAVAAAAPPPPRVGRSADSGRRAAAAAAADATLRPVPPPPPPPIAACDAGLDTPTTTGCPAIAIDAARALRDESGRRAAA